MRMGILCTRPFLTFPTYSCFLQTASIVRSFVMKLRVVCLGIVRSRNDIYGMCIFVMYSLPTFRVIGNGKWIVETIFVRDIYYVVDNSVIKLI